MTRTTCGYQGNRDDVLVAYVYDDIEPEERNRFEAHLAACVPCRNELSALAAVRVELAKWSPPEPSVTSHQSPATGHRSSVESRQWPVVDWRAIPAWVRVAAAMLVLGISAGIANLGVRYDRDGLTVRTGWMKNTAAEAGPRSPTGVAQPPSQGFGEPRRSSPGQSASGGGDVSPAASAPWRADLTALEKQIRTELHALQAEAPASSPSDADVLRRVRGLVEESERRQQRELALRVADMMRDVETQRRADLVKIDRNLGLIQSSTGVEVLKQRELLNYLVRASQNK